jgi:serine/threonine protein kinase
MKFRPYRRYATEGECAKMFFQLMSAVEYMHSHDVAHRDIKLENVLIE